MVTVPTLLVRKKWVLFLPQDSVPRKLRYLVRSEGKYCPLVAVFSEVCSRRRDYFFSSLKANWFNKQSGRILGECNWCSSAVICWLPTNYLNSGNETHPSVISPVTSSRCTKGASCETVLIANNRGSVPYKNERIAVRFWLKIINGTGCCAVQSHLAKLLEKKLGRKLSRRAVQRHRIQFLSQSARCLNSNLS